LDLLTLLYISLVVVLNSFLVWSFDYKQDVREANGTDLGSVLMKQLGDYLHSMMSFSFCRLLLQKSFKSRARKKSVNEILLRIHSFQRQHLCILWFAFKF